LALARETISEAYRESLEDCLKKAGFQVFLVENGEEALDMTKREIPDFVIADTNLPVIGGLDLLDSLKKNESLKKIPVMIFSKSGGSTEGKTALDLMATDFVIGFHTSPRDIVARIRSYFGEQKRYVVEVSPENEALRQLAKDTGYSSILECSSCGGRLVLQFLRDLKAGEKHFAISFICERCHQK